MINDNSVNNKEDNNKETNSLIIREDAFNDSFFKRDNDFDNYSSHNESHKSHNEYNYFQNTHEQEYEFSYSEYEREKKLAYGEEENSSGKLLIALFSAGAIGVVGYLGFNYLNSDKKSEPQNVNMLENRNITMEKKGSVEVENVIEANEKNVIVEISTPTPPPTTTPTPSTKPTPTEQTTSINSKQKEIRESVIKTLKEKKAKQVTPTPAKIIESVENSVHKDTIKPKIEKPIIKKKSKIVTDKIKKEKPKKPKYRVITVKKGDTLASISEKFYGNPMKFKRIIRANRDLKRGSTHLHPGQKLIIPLLDTKNSRRIVVVRKGDTLASIAKRFYGNSSKFQKIIDANYKIKDEHTPLHIGQKIYVPR